MGKSISEKSLMVLDYLKSIGDANVTAQDIADALGLAKKTVDGVVTAGLIRNKNYAERVEAEMEITGEDGSVQHKAIKLIKLTEAGKNYDHAAAVAADEAEKAAKAAEKAAAKAE